MSDVRCRDDVEIARKKCDFYSKMAFVLRFADTEMLREHVPDAAGKLTRSRHHNLVSTGERDN